MKTTPAKIANLAPNEVFVFGSNLAGRHGAGAALLAHIAPTKSLTNYEN